MSRSHEKGDSMVAFEKEAVNNYIFSLIPHFGRFFH